MAELVVRILSKLISTKCSGASVFPIRDPGPSSPQALAATHGKLLANCQRVRVRFVRAHASELPSTAGGFDNHGAHIRQDRPLLAHGSKQRYRRRNVRCRPQHSKQVGSIKGCCVNATVAMAKQALAPPIKPPAIVTVLRLRYRPMPYTAADEASAAYTANSSPRGAINPAINAFNMPANNAVGRSASSVISRLPVAKGMANAHSEGSFIGAFTFCKAVNSVTRNSSALMTV